MKNVLIIFGLILLTLPLFADLAPAQTIFNDMAYTGFHGSDAMSFPGGNLRFVANRFGGGSDYLMVCHEEGDDIQITTLDMLFRDHWLPPVLLDEGDGRLRILTALRRNGDVWQYVSEDGGQSFSGPEPFLEDVTVPIQIAGDNQTRYLMIHQGRAYNLNEFQYFSDNDSSVNGDNVWFWGPDVLHGTLHSNTDIWIKNAGGGSNGGWPTFHEMVTTAGNIESFSGTIPWDDVFLGGYETGVAPIQFSPTADEIREQGEYPLGHGVFDIVWIRLDGTGYESLIGEIEERPPDTLTVYDVHPPYAYEPGDSIGVNFVTFRDTVWISGPSGNLVDQAAMILADQLWIDGTCAGRQTWACSGDIYIVGDLLYENTEPGELPDDPQNYNETDFLGLVSEQSVIIKYGHFDPVDSVRVRPNCENGGVYIYGSVCALGDGQGDPYGDGVFTFEYQYPHYSTPGTFYEGEFIPYPDLHQCFYPPQDEYWPFPANGDGGYQYPTVHGPDYPWYNPLYPEAYPYMERGTIFLYGGVHQRRRGFVHRSGSDPMDSGYWDIENHFYGPEAGGVNAPDTWGTGVGYEKEYHYDSRLLTQRPPHYPIGYVDFDDVDYPAEIMASSGQDTAYVSLQSLPVGQYVRFSDIAVKGDTIAVALREDSTGETENETIRVFVSTDGGVTFNSADFPGAPLSQVRHLEVAITGMVNVMEVLQGGDQRNVVLLGLDAEDPATTLYEAVLSDWRHFRPTLLIDNGVLMLVTATDAPVGNRDQLRFLQRSQGGWVTRYSYQTDLPLEQDDPSKARVTGLKFGPEGELHLLFQSEFDPDQINAGLKYTSGTLPPLVPVHQDDVPEFTLSLSSYPNPFNPETTIEFSLPAAGQVTLEVFNLKGQLLETLVDDKLEVGDYRVVWNADTHPSGVYLVRLKAGGEVQTRRVSLIK